MYENDEEVNIVTELCRGGELFDGIVERVEIRKRWHRESERKMNDGVNAGVNNDGQSNIILQQIRWHQENERRMNDGVNDVGESNILQQRQVTAPPACFHERDAARIIRSLLSAVAYLHANDIVHRDIKPENILFANQKSSNDDYLRLIDFGLSIHHTQNCPPLTNTVGTAYYMAPELLDGKYDRSADLGLWAY